MRASARTATSSAAPPARLADAAIAACARRPAVGSATPAAPRARTCVPERNPPPSRRRRRRPRRVLPDFARSHHFASLPDLLLQAYRVSSTASPRASPGSPSISTATRSSSRVGATPSCVPVARATARRDSLSPFLPIAPPRARDPSKTLTLARDTRPPFLRPRRAHRHPSPRAGCRPDGDDGTPRGGQLQPRRRHPSRVPPSWRASDGVGRLPPEPRFHRRRGRGLSPEYTLYDVDRRIGPAPPVERRDDDLRFDSPSSVSRTSSYLRIWRPVSVFDFRATRRWVVRALHPAAGRAGSGSDEGTFPCSMRSRTRAGWASPRPRGAKRPEYRSQRRTRGRVRERELNGLNGSRRAR